MRAYERGRKGRVVDIGDNATRAIILELLYA